MSVVIQEALMTKAAVETTGSHPRWRRWLERFTAYEDAFFSTPDDTQDRRLARLEREVAGLRSQVADLRTAAACRAGSGPAED